MILPGVGPEGQARLAAAHAAIVGVGALGCVSAELLARAGVGRLTLIDRDVVELSNLQRQSLFDDRDATEGSAKASAAARAIEAIDPAVRVRAEVAHLGPDNARRLLGDAGVIIDGTDNFETRYLLNDLAVSMGVPMVYGGVVGTGGMQASFVPGRACLRCVFPEPPAPGSQPTCDTAGVLAPAAWMVGAAQATDAIKLLLGRADALSGSLQEFDLWSNERRRLPLPAPDPGCPCCGLRRFDFLDGTRAGAIAGLCGRVGVQVLPPPGAGKVDFDVVASRWSAVGEVVRSQGSVVVRTAGRGGVTTELRLFADARAIVRGVETPEAARALYDRLVGG